MAPVLEANAFDRVGAPRRRPGFTVAPIVIAWEAVVFRLSGRRDAIVCVPRADLAGFLDELDAGALDGAVDSFLATPPGGRELRAVDRLRSTELFDTMVAPEAIVRRERVPGRALGIGRGGGTPADARARKRHGGRHAPRGVVAAVAAGVVALGAVIAVVATRGDSKATVSAAASTSTTALVTSTTAPDVQEAVALQGTWTVTRTVTASNNPRQPVGQVLTLGYVLTTTCTVSPCTVHVDAEGSQGAREQIDLRFVDGHYEGTVAGTTPCRSFTTGELLGETTITGSLSVRADRPNHFTGTLTLKIVPNDNCVASSITYSLDAVK